jgi:hypothetical protein
MFAHWPIYPTQLLLDYVTPYPPFNWKKGYDLVKNEPQLSYEGSTLVPYPLTPTLHYLNNYLCKYISIIGRQVM